MDQLETCGVSELFSGYCVLRYMPFSVEWGLYILIITVCQQFVDHMEVNSRIGLIENYGCMPIIIFN